MKTVTSELAALINTGDFTCFDLYTLDLVGGGRLLMTAADFDIAYGGTTWSAKGVRITGAPRGHWKTGLDVDQWTIKVAPRRRDDFTGADFPDRIGSTPFLQAVALGALDGAAVTVSRAYFGAKDRGIDIFFTPDVFTLEDVFAQDAVSAPVYPIPPDGAVPGGVLTLFKGNIAEVEVDTTTATLTINDARQILTTQMPRNVYQSSCRHRLFDSGCQIAAVNYARNVRITNGTNRTRIVFLPAWPAVGSGFLQLGRVVVVSGANAGLARTIASWDTGYIIGTVSPFPYEFAVGDVLTLYPGCDKTMATCNRFGNLINFGGEPYIPVPETTA